MNDLIKITLIGTFFGTFGTTLGGIIGASIKNTTNKFLSFILELAAGLMTGIVCFDLIPEAIKFSNIANAFIGIIIGVITMIVCDNFLSQKSIKTKGSNGLLRTGIIIGIGLAIHNFPEGLAIGSVYGASIKLGVSLAIAIALHDIPEGISMSVPMKNGGMKKHKVILYTFLSGITTGMGAFFGRLIGGVSNSLISISLSFAAGAMLYIISGELVPESHKLYKGRLPSIGYILGILLGIIATII